jgi:hyperosmotically inducible periplasmic protein
MKSTLAIPLLLAGALLMPYAASGQTPAPDSSGTQGQAVPPESTEAASQAQSAAGTTVTTTESTTTTTAQNSTTAADVPSKIKAEMAAQNVASAPDISVDSDSTGGVVLSGTAQSQEDIDKVMSIARGTAGVTSVKNDIKVKPQG